MGGDESEGSRAPAVPLVLFGDAEAAAELFRRVRWADGVHCPKSHTDIVKFCKYGEFQRYTYKTCEKTFNDKTGTLLYYRHIGVGDWMLAVWMYFCGSLNGISIDHIAKSVSQVYGTAYYMIRDIMDKVRSLQEKVLSSTYETDGPYAGRAPKAYRWRPTARLAPFLAAVVCSRGQSAVPFQKNTHMVTIYRCRAAGNEQN